MFMSAVVPETVVSMIYSATSYHSLLVQYAVFFRVITPRLRRGRVISPMCVCVCVCD